MNVLGVFAKYPQAGQVKTRLAASIGEAAATELYAAFVKDLIARSGLLADRVRVAVAPETQAADNWFRPLVPNNGSLEFQPDGDLGQRIAWFFDEAGQGGDRRVLIGSDSPDLPASLIANAFAALESHDIVLGPATDGGFVLVGMNDSPQALFADVRWSSPTTLLDVLQAADQLQRTTALLQPWYDIDTVENLGTLLALQHSSPYGGLQAAPCPCTVAVLRNLWPRA